MCRKTGGDGQYAGVTVEAAKRGRPERGFSKFRKYPGETKGHRSLAS